MKLAAALFIFSLLFSFFVISPSIKSITHKYFLQTERKILSQMTVDRAGSTYKILKLKDVKGLALEVYKLTEEGLYELADREELTDTKDAYYVFNDKKLNLFLKDLDDDKFPEIVLPSIDKNMAARLNVYSFDIYTGKLNKESRH